MEIIFYVVGAVGFAVCGVGGLLLSFTIIGYLARAACCAWGALGNRIRSRFKKKEKSI